MRLDGRTLSHETSELRGYLRCGDFARGFVHARCTLCGHDLLIAFSCRGLCPSCAGRRMASSAAFLVDRVLPVAPLRQYVLAFPYELSCLAATRPEVLAHLCRIFWETLRRRYRRWAKGAGYTRVETGSKIAFDSLTLFRCRLRAASATTFSPPGPKRRRVLRSRERSEPP